MSVAQLEPPARIEPEAASLKWSLFPLGGPGRPAHLFLPALTAGLGGAAWYARMMRSSNLDILATEYVRTARAKGRSVVLVERVFNWPGLRRLAVEAIATVDVPLILGTVIVTALMVVLSGILIDVVQGIVDPRIRYGQT